MWAIDVYKSVCRQQCDMCRYHPDNICIDLKGLYNQYSLFYTHIKMGGCHYIVHSIIMIFHRDMGEKLFIQTDTHQDKGGFL